MQAKQKKRFSSKDGGNTLQLASSGSAKSDIRLMSFRELRQLQKVASESMVGPGTYDIP